MIDEARRVAWQMICGRNSGKPKKSLVYWLP